MHSQAMSNEENYCFDVAGYLHLPGVLGVEEVARLNSAIDEIGETTGMLAWPGAARQSFRDLLIQPTMVCYLNQLVGSGFILDREPEVWCEDSCDTSAPLVGGNEPRDPSIAYYFQNGRRFCEGARVLWALEDVQVDDGGFSLVPCSHKDNVVTPENVATGAKDMGLTLQPALKAGDLLVVALTALQGMRPWRGAGRQRLLNYEYVGRGVVRSVGPHVGNAPRPEWHEDLSEAQRASLYSPGYADTTPPPTIVTDSKTVKVDPSREIFHPSFLRPDPDSGIDHDEFYFWDLNGYLVLRGVMDDEWLAAANEAVEGYEDRIEVGEELARGSTALAGSGRPLLQGLLQLPAPHCEAFRRMIAHPAVEHRLNWMGASGGWTGDATGFVAVKGTSGHALHDANEPLNPTRGYVYQNGRSFCEAVTVTWQLRDVKAGDGGFACVPGSHKAYYKMPQGIRTCDDDMGLVKHVEMQAGDVLFFGDGGTTHGALAWQSETARRGILIKYSSRNFNRAGGDMVHPENRWGEVVAGMSDAQLAVMRGPDRDVFEHNVPRLEVVDGEVEVSYERGSTLYSREAPSGPVTKEKNKP